VASSRGISQRRAERARSAEVHAEGTLSADQNGVAHRRCDASVLRIVLSARTNFA
jgi:hypothetical protein